MTWICHRGIELSARSSSALLGFEFVILLVFSIVALIDVYSGNAAAHSIKPQLDWFNPFAISFGDLLVAMLLESSSTGDGTPASRSTRSPRMPTEGPGRAAVVSTFMLVAIYLLVSAGAQAFHGTGFISSEENASDVLHALGKGVLGSVGVRFLIVTVLTSAAASTQTTILPTARTTLSMAKWGAISSVIGKIHPRFLTPTVSTWGFGVLSVLIAVPLILISEAVLELSVVALGIPVCFYYGSTGFACLWYYRREIFDSARKFFLVGLLPLLGGLIMFGIGIKAITYYGHKVNAEDKEYLGLTLPIWFGGIGMIVGLVLAWISRPYFRPFFSRKTETAAPGLLDALVERAPTHLMGSEHVTTAEHPFTPEAAGESLPKPSGRPGDASLRDRLIVEPACAGRARRRPSRRGRVGRPRSGSRVELEHPVREPYSASSVRNGSAGNASGPSTPAPVHSPRSSSSSATTGLIAVCHTTAWRAVLAHRPTRCRPRGRGRSRGLPSVPVPVHPACPRRSCRHPVAEVAGSGSTAATTSRGDDLDVADAHRRRSSPGPACGASGAHR